MIPVKLRLIREHNRIYKCWMRMLWRWYGKKCPYSADGAWFQDDEGGMQERV